MQPHLSAGTMCLRGHLNCPEGYTGHIFTGLKCLFLVWDKNIIMKFELASFPGSCGLHFNIADLLKRGGSVLSLANLVDYNIAISRGFERNTFAR